MENPRLRVLVIEDDEDDYILVRNLLAEVPERQFHVDWASDYDTALEEMCRGPYDVHLLDYRLGGHDGLALLKEARSRGCDAPVIFVTGEGSYAVDMESMQAGASDYIVKGRIDGYLLERSIRYAIERKRAEDALRESEKQLRYLSARLLTIQEEERTRLAQEIHDSIGQTLAAIKFGIESALGAKGRDRAKAMAQCLESLVPNVRSAIDEVRRIYMDLRPTVLDDFGIVATVGWYCREFEKSYPHIAIRTQVDIQEDDVPKPMKIIIYRVVQEALHNVARHSSANRVRLSLVRTGSTIQLTVKDNGLGFDKDALLSWENPPRGIGLASMKERTELVGGSLSIESVKGEGTTVSASWPHA
jgi:signal transduction histidine kinase